MARLWRVSVRQSEQRQGVPPHWARVYLFSCALLGLWYMTWIHSNSPQTHATPAVSAGKPFLYSPIAPRRGAGSPSDSVVAVAAMVMSIYTYIYIYRGDLELSDNYKYIYQSDLELSDNY